MIIFTAAAGAQFKSQLENQPSASQSLLKPQTSIGSFFGLLNPDAFSMRHNFAFNYISIGGSGMSLASYTNSMFYRISDPLNVRFDVTMQGSPFGQRSFSGKNDLNKVYLSRAELNYKPLDNLFFTLQYNSLPFGYWGSYPFNSVP